MEETLKVKRLPVPFSADHTREAFNCTGKLYRYKCMRSLNALIAVEREMGSLASNVRAALDGLSRMDDCVHSFRN